MNHPTKPPRVFFDVSTSGYWLQVADTRFLPLQSSQVRLHLRHAGLDSSKSNGHLNEVERALLVSMREKYVDYAGPLAGHRCGVFKSASGSRILVTSEPSNSVFEPATAKADCLVLEQFLNELLGPVQMPYFLGWSKSARASLFNGDFRPGQCLILAGPSAVGKSLLQALITEFLGGRVARPYRYMTGQTPFNADLASAEHLAIEDEHASTDIRARRKFGSSIKDFAVNKEISVHGKGRQAITLPTFRRVTVSVNSEPENLMILPPLDESILDKIILLKCARADVGPDRLKVWKQLSGELPAFAAMLESWRIPRSLQDHRFGVCGYVNPELFDLVSEISPENRLANLIDQVLFEGPKALPEFTGTAEQLEQRLACSPFAMQVEKLLYFSSACGVYLARLAQRRPDRFASSKCGRGKTIWSIKS